MATGFGDMFDALNSVSERRTRTSKLQLMQQVPQVLKVCGLPQGAGNVQRVRAALLHKDYAAYALRRHLKPRILKRLAQGDGPPAVHQWAELPDAPQTEAQWELEAAQAKLVVGKLQADAELAQALLLWIDYCSAKLANLGAAAAGRPAGALDVLLRTRVPPGQRRWQPDMSLLMAAAGGLQRELLVDAPLGLDSHGGIKTIMIEEAKWDPTGTVEAKAQLERSTRAIACVHGAVGAPLPKFEACLVVPRSQRRVAEEKLGRLLKWNWQASVDVPLGLGSAAVVWTVDTL